MTLASNSMVRPMLRWYPYRHGCSILARSGFSLIEVMIVLAIVAILFSIGFATLRDQRRTSEVQAQAEQLAAVLRLTRNRAINEETCYGVAFNIRNGLDTSGAVLNNWDGGHFYRVIGPQRIAKEFVQPTRRSKQFPDFVREVEDCWVSQPFVLPQRSVRFIALSDLDRGPRRHKNGGAWAEQYYDGDPTYPRPWFGVYDDTDHMWWPWGGYDPSKDYSGFYFEGKDGDIVGSRNPSDRIYPTGTIWRAGEGRDLVKAEWLDAVIWFVASGEAMFQEWNLGRRSYRDEPSTLGDFRDGIRDRALKRNDGLGFTRDGNIGSAFNTTSPFHSRTPVHPESQHFMPHTGGFHITLAPDALVDTNRFETVDEALDTIDPAWRVFVGASGAIRVFRVQRRRSGSWLDERGTWPANPDDWQDVNVIRENHQIGWLHETGTVGWTRNAVPIGEPIVDRITGRMLTERIWWFNE